MNDALREQISAYADGELPEQEAELLLRRLEQDKSLRDLLASHMAVGRAMRSEPEVSGIGNLRDRISTALADEKPFNLGAKTPVANRYVKPFAGVAIAASVAVLALVGFQQTTDSNVRTPTAGATAVAQVNNELAVYTVPAPATESGTPSGRLQSYYVRHGESALASGVNGIRSRLVSFELRENELIDRESELERLESDQPDSGK